MVSGISIQHESFYLLLIAYLHTVKWFQVLLCTTNNSIKHEPFVYTQLNDKTVPFLIIQFSISHLFPLRLNVKQSYWTLSGATTPSQIEPGSYGNEKVLHIPQFFKTGVLPSDCLMSYPGHSLEESCPSAEM